MKRKKGFTLVEVLVLIAIVTLLVALLLPVASKAREMTRKTRCLSNLRVLGQMALTYASENNGQLPLAVEDLNGNNTGYPHLNPQFVTNEMNVAFGFQSVLDASGNPNGNPFSRTWQCPSAASTLANPSDAANVSSWLPVLNASPAGSVPYYPAKTISRWSNVLETSYAYCGNGLGNTRFFSTAKNQSNTYASFVRDALPSRLSSSKPGPLYVDKIEWHYTKGFSANHGIVLRRSGGWGNPTTPGQNQVFSDGHGEWVNWSNITLLNAGQVQPLCPAVAASVPLISYPQALPLPKGYPALMHQAIWPFYEMWYW